MKIKGEEKFIRKEKIGESSKFEGFLCVHFPSFPHFQERYSSLVLSVNRGGKTKINEFFCCAS